MHLYRKGLRMLKESIITVINRYKTWVEEYGFVTLMFILTIALLGVSGTIILFLLFYNPWFVLPAFFILKFIHDVFSTYLDKKLENLPASESTWGDD
jgi:hypothetical protein